MAVATCIVDNIRLNPADDISNGIWSISGEGVGAIAETDIVYQGVTAISRKISLPGRGIYYTHDSEVDMSATSSTSTCLFKVNITNYSTAPTTADGGISIWCGKDVSNNYESVYLGSDAYPIGGGWVLVPFAPSSAWASIKGSPPPLDSITGFGIQVNAAFSAVSKSENVVIDAIDVGTGIYISGGTGLDSPGTFDDIVLFDQGNLSNRWGYVTKNDDVISVYGRIGIGFTDRNAASGFGGQQSTRFEDAGNIIVFPDGLMGSNFSGIDIETGTGSTESFIYIENCTFIGISGGLGVVNTRPNIWVSGNQVGYCTFFNNRFVRFREFCEVDANIQLDVVDCLFDDIERYEHYAGYIDGCVFNGAPQIPPNVGMLTCFTRNVERISNCTFAGLGTEGHAIEIQVAGSYDFSGNKFIGYAGNPGSNLVEGSGDPHAAILNSSGGLVTLNIVGEGDCPSIRNIGSGSTTIILNSKVDDFST